MSLLVLFNSAVVAGTLVSVPIVQTVGAGGVQFDLVYDSAALTLEEFIPAVGTSPITNPQPGRFRFIVTQTTPLPEELGVFVFLVNSASLLTLENVVVGSPLGQPIEVEIINGAINLENGMATINFAWDDNNSTPLNDYVLRVSQDSTSPASGVWSDAASATVQEAGVEMAPDTGEFAFYVVGKFSGLFGSGETAPSNVLVLNTAQPLPMEALRLA